MKKFFKVLTVLLIIAGTAFAVVNFLPTEVEAKEVKWEEIHEKNVGFGTLYWCEGDGDGCCTIIVDAPKQG